jgi:NADH dehydrogenase FAD-containing subunit
MPPEPANVARVVAVGGGFGGLSTVQALRRAPVQVTLIDRENHHVFQPLLYQAATAALTNSDIAWPIRGLLRRQANVRVIMAEVSGIDGTVTERLSVPAHAEIFAIGDTATAMRPDGGPVPGVA